MNIVNVSINILILFVFLTMLIQRLSGASLLVFANKQDIQGALSPDEIAKVSVLLLINKFVRDA